MWTNQADPYRLEPQSFMLHQTVGSPQMRTPLGSTKRVPLFGVDVGLAQNAAERSNRYFGLLGYDGGVNGFFTSTHKFDVTAFLRSFDESRCLKSPLDIAEWKGLKPPQPQPR
jgi:hypothetical protein